MKRILLLVILLVLFIGCEDEVNSGNFTSNYNSIYVGDWNFKGNGVSFSGYYTYDSLLNSQWVENVTITTNYNDSTGSVQLGENINELIFKYCESCEPIIYNLNDSGFVYSESLG